MNEPVKLPEKRQQKAIAIFDFEEDEEEPEEFDQAVKAAKVTL